MNTLNVYTKDNKLIHSFPCDYTMSNDLLDMARYSEGQGIQGGSFLQNIPIIGGIAKLLGLGFQKNDGCGIKGGSFLQNIPIIGDIAKILGLGFHSGSKAALAAPKNFYAKGISGLGISGAAIHDINGGFLNALLPFVPTLISAIPSVLNLLKGEGISGGDLDEKDYCDYKLEFISGNGVDYEKNVKMHPLTIDLLKSKPNFLHDINQNIEKHISGIGISGKNLGKGISGSNIQQSISQINTGKGISGSNIQQSISHINTGEGISGAACGVNRGVYGGSFKSNPKIFKHSIGEF